MAEYRIHLMRWWPQDWLSSTVRMQSIMTGDRDMRLVYLEILNVLWDRGGRVPSEPDALAAMLGLPRDVVADALPKLLALGSGRSGGGLVDNGDGTLSNRRVTADLRDHKAFLDQQREHGRRGGRPRKGVSAEKKASLSSQQPEESTACKKTARKAKSQPLPLPLPLPLPNGNGNGQQNGTSLRSVPPTGDTPAGMRAMALFGEHPAADVIKAAVDIWYERWGKGSVNGGQVAAAISPLLKHHPSADVLLAWRWWVAKTQDYKPTPGSFRQRFAEWLSLARTNGPWPTAGRKPTVDANTDRVRATLQRAAEARKEEIE